MAHIKVYIFCQSEVGTGHYVRCNNIRKGLDDCQFEYITGTFTDDERRTIFTKQLEIINDYKPDVILLDGFPFMRYEWFDSGMELSFEPMAKKISTVLFVLVLLGAIAAERENIVSYFAQAGLITLVLNVVMMVVA